MKKTLLVSALALAGDGVGGAQMLTETEMYVGADHRFIARGEQPPFARCHAPPARDKRGGRCGDGAAALDELEWQPAG